MFLPDCPPVLINIYYIVLKSQLFRDDSLTVIYHQVVPDSLLTCSSVTSHIYVYLIVMFYPQRYQKIQIDFSLKLCFLKEKKKYLSS